MISLLISLSITVQAILPSPKKLAVEKIKKATHLIEVWKRPIDEKTGRRHFAAKDELVTRAVAIGIGDGYLLAPLHVMKPIVEKAPYHYVKVMTSTGLSVKNLAISKCDLDQKGMRIDLCLLKGDISRSSTIDFPKDIGFLPSEDSTFGLLNKNIKLAPLNTIVEGKYVKDVYLENTKIQNNNITLYRTSIKTIQGNSGSIVFNTVTGRILGITTNAWKRRRNQKSKEVSLEAEVIPVQTIRKYLNKPGWKSKPLPKSQTSY